MLTIDIKKRTKETYLSFPSGFAKMSLAGAPLIPNQPTNSSASVSKTYAPKYKIT